MIGWKRSVFSRSASPAVVPVLLEDVHQPARAGQERVALAPVRADLVEALAREARDLAGEVLDQRVAVVRAVHPPQVGAEDHLVGLAGAVQVDHVVQRAAALELAQHRPDRRDAAAGADEQRLLRQRVGQAELALDLAEEDHRARLDLAREERRHQPFLDVLDRDRDEPLGMVGIRGQRVGAPVADAVELGADAQVLPGPVARPRERRAHDDGRRLVGLGLEPHDRPGQLARRPRGVQQPEVVVGDQRKRDRSGDLHRPSPEVGNGGCRRAFDHLAPTLSRSMSSPDFCLTIVAPRHRCSSQARATPAPPGRIGGFSP